MGGPAVRAWMPAVGLLPLLSALGAGCLACEPLLDVRACGDAPDVCAVTEGELVDWGPEHAAAWPALDALLGNVTQGTHTHASWQGDADAFWSAMGVAPGAHTEAYIEKGGVVHRVRILAC